jgi:hypothetical protein
MFVLQLDCASAWHHHLVIDTIETDITREVDLSTLSLAFDIIPMSKRSVSLSKS